MKRKAVWCQGLEQTHLPRLLQPGSTHGAWPPPWPARWASSHLHVGYVAPSNVPGSLNLLCKCSGFGEPPSPDLAGSSESLLQLHPPLQFSDPPQSMQTTLIEARRLPQVHPTQDSLEKWLPDEVSHRYLRATSGDLLSSQPARALLEQPRAPRASPTMLPWPKSHGEAPGVPGAPIPFHLATVGLFALGLQLCSCCSRRGFARGCRMGP